MSQKPIGARARRKRTWRAVTAAAVLLAAFGGNVLAASPAAAAPNPVVVINSSDTQAQIVAKAATVTPTARQLAWQREELTGFLHFGPNTFTGEEWGHGNEDPDLFNPSQLSTDQWAATFRDAGFKKIILTAKHHDGFLLFPSSYSAHGVASSSWRNGGGDVVREFADSAREYGLKIGLYLSPSDLHEALSGGRYATGSTSRPVTIPSNPSDIVNGVTFSFSADDYNAYYENTLYELLTRYGQIDEVWWDNANPLAGGNPPRIQPYSFPDWTHMVRTLHPNAVIFNDNGPDVRYVGNESGAARTSEWSALPFAGNPATAGDAMLTVPGGNNGGADLASDSVLGWRKSDGSSSWNGLRWTPAECDTTLHANSKWFWSPTKPLKSLGELENTYYTSVGRNCQLLLNVPPDNTGRLPADAVTRMQELGSWIRSVQAKVPTASANNDAGTSNTSGNGPGNVLDNDDATAWQPVGTTGNLVVDLVSDKAFNVVDLQENIQVGQRVSGFAVDAWNGTAWNEVASATTIGYRRLLKLDRTVITSKVRLRITGSRTLPPAIATFALHQDRVALTNLALNKPATQSSTVYGAPASRAVDGNTNGAFGSGSVTHTSESPFDANPWWQVDLGASQHVSSVRLWNRTDCCAERLRLFYVFASDSPFTSNDPAATAAQPGVWNAYRDAQAGTSLSFPVSRTARYIRVQLVGSDRPLSLSEVEVLGNLALSGTATQSSTHISGGVASRAIDGNTNGSYGAGSVTHTSDTPLGANPWWQVDLGSVQHVSSVKLWNRTDCCSDRLRQFYIFVSDTPFTSNDPAATAAQPGVWNVLQGSAVGTSLTVPVGRTARYIRVQLVGSDRPLSLAEAEVFG